MALEDLITQGYSGNVLTDAQRQQYQDTLMNAMRAEIERSSGNQFRQGMENTFGRGLGLSTVSRDFATEQGRLRDETLTKALRDATVAARQAQMAALGQASAYDLGLKRQALAQRGQEQGERQFNVGQRNARSMQGNQLLVQGLGGLVGTGSRVAGQVYGPEIKSGLKGLFGGGRPEIPAPGGPDSLLGPEAGAPEYTPPEMFGAAEGGSYMPDYGSPYDFDPGAMPQVNTDYSFPDWTEGMSGLEALIQPQNWWDSDNWGL